MNRQPLLLFAFVLGLLLTGGCATPVALRRQTVTQGGTVADIHEQQVLDNLAKFVADPYAIPSFAVATSGAANVDDQCSGGLGLSWISSGFDSLSLSLGRERSQGTSWVMTPVTDPRKLELMRCAYQRVLTQCGYFPAESTSCPNCEKRFNKFYTGREENSVGMTPEAVYYDGEMGDEGILVLPSENLPCDCNEMELPGQAEVTGLSACEACGNSGRGIVTSECLSCENGRWFCWSHDATCVPKGCSHVGQYCGVYVWVPCGPSRDELAKLTLAILDYAVHDDAAFPTKEIEAYLDCHLQPTTQGSATYTVKTLVSLDESTDTIHMGDHIKKVCVEPVAAAGEVENVPSPGPGRSSIQRPIPSARPYQRLSPTPGSYIPLDQQMLNTL